jgi:hypothetical protein
MGSTTRGSEARVAAHLAPSGLKQTVGGFNEAVGLSSRGPGNNAVDMSVNQSRYGLHRFDPPIDRASPAHGAALGVARSGNASRSSEICCAPRSIKVRDDVKSSEVC